MAARNLKPLSVNVPEHIRQYLKDYASLHDMGENTAFSIASIINQHYINNNTTIRPKKPKILDINQEIYYVPSTSVDDLMFEFGKLSQGVGKYNQIFFRKEGNGWYVIRGYRVQLPEREEQYTSEQWYRIHRWCSLLDVVPSFKESIVTNEDRSVE